MRFKTKYNIGDIVKFFNSKINDYDIGNITRVSVSFSFESGQEEKYKVNPIRINDDYYDHSIEINETSVYKKLNKKAFEKEFAKKCVKYIEKVGGESER